MALLDGLLHCYTPSLGPTGYRLIDRGPRRINGRFTTLPITAWVGTQGNKWALLFTSNNILSNCGFGPATNGRTVIAWFRTSATTTNKKVIFSFAAFTTIGQSFEIFQGSPSGASGGIGVTQNFDSFGVTGYSDNRWHMIGVVNIGTSWTIYMDGRDVASKTMVTVPTSTTVYIGNMQDGLAAWSGEIGEVVSFTRAISAPEMADIFRRGDGAIGRMLTGQSYREARLSQAIAAGGATPWLYARRRSQIIGAGGVH